MQYDEASSPQVQQAWQQQQQHQYATHQGSLAPPTSGGLHHHHIYPSGGLTAAAASSSSENLFDRSTEGFPKAALDQSAVAKYRLEHHYSLSLDQAIERSE
ncbi:hypothetical protein BGZ92_002865, partial [Podila epicladia]